MSLLGGSLRAKNELDITSGATPVNMSVVVGAPLDADNHWLAEGGCFVGPAATVNIHYVIEGALFDYVS